MQASRQASINPSKKCRKILCRYRHAALILIKSREEGASVYLINGNTKKIRTIKGFLREKGVECEETKSSEYLAVREKPGDVLPAFLLSGVKVIEASVRDAVRIYKNYGSITQFIGKKAKLPVEGQVVHIISGEYKDLNLSGKVVNVGQKGCSIELLAWGNLLRLNVGFDDIEIIGSDD